MAKLNEAAAAQEAENPVKVGQVPPVQKLRVELRIIGATRAASRNSGRDQVTLDLEIVRPEIATIHGASYPLAGQKTKMYLGLEGKGLPQTLEFHRKLELPEDVDTDDINEAFYTGGDPIVFSALMSSEDTSMMEFNPETQKNDLPVKDKNGNEIKGRRWALLSTFNILERVRE